MNKIISKITAGALLCTMLAYQAPILAYTKEETVYTKLKQNGESYNKIVNTHLKNEEAQKTIKDITDLLNIENVGGNETFKQNEEEIIWDANGNDIYYQGETKKELPIECKIKYELNGGEINSKDIAGKSGKVKITIEYINKDKHEERINGKTEEIYTPFTVVCGLILQNENNKNIKITNGKVVDDGTKTTLVGISMPGLKESLGIQEDILTKAENSSKFNIEKLDKVEITMDTTNFELGNIITYVTPNLLEENINFLDNIDKIYEKVNTIQNSSKQLVEGTNTLKDGTKTLKGGIQELKGGINEAYNGVSLIKTKIKQANNLLKDNTEALDEKTIEEIGKKAEQTAINSLNSKQSNKQSMLEIIENEAEQGAEQKIKSTITSIGNTAKETANKQMQTQLDKIAESAKKQVEENMQGQLDKIANTAKQEAKKTIEKQLETIGKTAQNMVTITLTPKQEQEISKQVEEDLKKDPTFNNLPEEEQKVILSYSKASAIKSAKTALEKQGKQVAKQVAQNTALETAQNTASSVAPQVAKNITGEIIGNTAKTVALQVAGNVAEQIAQNTALQVSKSVAGEISKNVATQVTKSVSNNTAKSVAKQVANETKQVAMEKIIEQMGTLSGGLDSLGSGLEKLNNGSLQLLDGSIQLSNGSEELAKGMTEFDEKAIGKLCNYINGDIKDITNRAKALKKLGEEYSTFKKINADNQSRVKFIMVMDSIKKEDNEKEE